MQSLTEQYDIVSKELTGTDLGTLLLKNRDISELDTFLNPQWSDNHDPFTMMGMHDAVERIISAIDRKEAILIFSDFDADGIPGAVVLSDFFKKIGYQNVEVHIPNRNRDGFGLNMTASQRFIDNGVSLLITIDCGISDIDEIALLRSGGVDVIVTDHHLPSDQGLPDAIVVDPKQEGCQYPFKELCGSGVVFKMVQALLQTKVGQDIPSGWEKTLMDMVGIATICDMVPLIGENRLFAWSGLKMIRLSRRNGLRELLNVARVQQGTVSAQDVAFTLGPRINAASRISDPMIAFKALAHGGREIRELEELNKQRKSVVARAAKSAYKKIEGSKEDSVIVVGDTAWQPGVVGLIAGHIAGKYSKPAFVWTRVGEEYRGSVRSGGVCSINELMNLCPKDTFMSFGGHDAAGGFVCNNEQIHSLSERLNTAYKKCIHSQKKKTPIDAILSMDDVSDTNWKIISALEPYGVGNLQPLFLFEDIPIADQKLFGSHSQHLNLSFTQSDGRRISAIRFNSKDNEDTLPTTGDVIDLVATFEMNHYNGSSELRLRIEDFYIKHKAS